MFKIANKIFSLIMTLTLLFSTLIMPLYATTVEKYNVEPRWSNVSSGVIGIDLNSDKVKLNIKLVGAVGTTFNNGRIVLTRENNGTVTTVKTWTGCSSNSNLFSFSDSSCTKKAGTYTLTITITAIKNGVSEEISISKTE